VDILSVHLLVVVEEEAGEALLRREPCGLQQPGVAGSQCGEIAAKCMAPVHPSLSSSTGQLSVPDALGNHAGISSLSIGSPLGLGSPAATRASSPSLRPLLSPPPCAFPLADRAARPASSTARPALQSVSQLVDASTHLTNSVARPAHAHPRFGYLHGRRGQSRPPAGSRGERVRRPCSAARAAARVRVFLDAREPLWALQVRCG
jgi:hypothetical protein